MTARRAGTRAARAVEIFGALFTLLARFPRLATGGEPTRRGGIGRRGFDALPVTVA